MSKFLQGTIILIIAGLITRVLGFVNRIVVARMIGDEGVGTLYDGGPHAGISNHLNTAWATGCHIQVSGRSRSFR